MKKDLTLTLMFLAALLISVVSIIISFPAEKDYLATADEGTYFKQAQKAISFNTNYAAAYINICSAYNEMK